MPRLARADRVEQAEDDDREILLPMIGEAQKLIRHLGCRIPPAAMAGRAENTIIGLGEGDADPFAIDL
jgi:hypothetical protein